MKHYQASAKGDTVTATTPKGAAQLFFQRFPNRRKCNVIEGVVDGPFFTVVYDRDNWPLSFKDVTKKTMTDLPDEGR